MFYKHQGIGHLAQIENPQQDVFIICPNTRIQLGVLENPTGNDMRIIVNGDVPLMVLRNNVQVQCGLDGAVRNNCAMVGGFVQVLLQRIGPTTFSTAVYETSSSSSGVNYDYDYSNPPEEEEEDYFVAIMMMVNATDNVTIRGMTFTGNVFRLIQSLVAHLLLF
jgi:hypothetical protein